MNGGTDAARTEVITVRGIVQGVGFRPTVYRIAAAQGMKGRVRNMGGGVQIIVTDTSARIDAFVAGVRAGKPRMARIDGLEREVIGLALFDDFQIAASSADEDEIAVIPADIALCDDCLREYSDPENPRYRHPFISCVNCGPRYTVMERLPYDRHTTTMRDFPMCGFCAGEYKDPATRRHHAQTVSCHGCGPQPIWRGNPGAAGERGGGTAKSDETAGAVGAAESGGSPAVAVTAESDETAGAVGAAGSDWAAALDEMGAGTGEAVGSGEATDAARTALSTGGVIALKGVGGYYLVCLATDADAAARLRAIKRREQKPFAVMFADARAVKDYCRVNPAEEAELVSPRRPVVLLEQRPVTAAGRRPLAPQVCNTSRFVGAFLPSFALQTELLEGMDPVVMTSANITDLPIITEDADMFALASQSGGLGIAGQTPEPVQTAAPRIAERAQGIAGQAGELALAGQTGEPRIAGVLYNTRRIAAGLDDSVVRVVDGTAQMLRRAKGFVPSPVFVNRTDWLTKHDHIFAAGAHLKSAFALSKGSFSYLSRHLGDINGLAAEELYRETFARMKAFFSIAPGLAACDLHPGYFPTRFAEAYGSEAGVPVLHVQHHHAHTASVMAEHGLSGPVVGVSFDGTGYGMDGAIWGGEVLICEGTTFDRFSHLRYVDMIGGDASMKEGWKSALSQIEGWREKRDAGCAGGDSIDGCEKRARDSAGFTNHARDSANHAYGSANHARGSAGGGANYARDGGSREFGIDLSEIIAWCEREDALHEWAAERPAVFAAIRAGVNTFRSSSMGRLFDAVASMLGIHHVNRYEGECAVLLENAAERALRGSNSEQDRLALRFHRDVAAAVLEQCRHARELRGVNTVCLSGGVFQNKILMEETLRLLRGDAFEACYNIHVPPNDGGIALGQNYLGMLSLRR